jgi:hypothetical protein
VDHPDREGIRVRRQSRFQVDLIRAPGLTSLDFEVVQPELDPMDDPLPRLDDGKDLDVVNFARPAPADQCEAPASDSVQRRASREDPMTRISAFPCRGFPGH